MLLKHKSSCALMSGSAFFSDYVGHLGNEQEAEHKKVHQVLQSQKEAVDVRLTQELEQVTFESDAKLEKKGCATF